MLKEEILEIAAKLERIKRKGYIKSTRKEEGTLYDLLDNKKYKDIKIKIKKDFTRDYVTIFNATPEGKDPNQLKRIKEKYGYAESYEFRKKIFNASIQANSFKFVNGKLFRLIIDYDKKRVILGIYNKDYTLIDNKSYWTFNSLETKLNKHVKYLFLVKSWDKLENKKYYFKYYDYNIYELINFQEFLRLLEIGSIRVTFRINVYKKGDKKGEINDLGTSFEFQELDYEKIYKKCQ